MVFGRMRSYIRIDDEGQGVAGHNQYQLFETAAGVAAIGWTNRGVMIFRLPGPTTSEAERAVLRRLPHAVRADPPAETGAVIDAAIRYFRGERIEFFDVAIDLGEQPAFFAKVYALVRRLGWGETTTYGAVAQALHVGPEHARAVGQAMAMNPVPLIIPCHRVMAAGGKIDGFSAPGGSLSKARMLELEGVPVAPIQRGFDF